MPIYVLQVIVLLHCQRCRIAPSSAACLVTALCAALSNQALRRLGCGEQGWFLFQIESSAGCPGWANHRLKRSPQYSSANMIVITRLVTDGSAGSGEWYVRLSSK